MQAWFFGLDQAVIGQNSKKYQDKDECAPLVAAQSLFW